MWLWQWLRSRSMENPWNLPIRNVGLVAPEIYRGAWPSPAGLEALADVGVRTVVNLAALDVEAAREERRECERLGLAYAQAQLDDHGEVDLALVDEVVAILSGARPADYPPRYYVHCRGGRHRTGVVVATYRVKVQGWAGESAYDEALKFGFYRHRHAPYDDYLRTLES